MTDTVQLWCISLWQPYASLIMLGEKEYETRHWRPNGIKPGDMLVIHAAKRWTEEEEDICEDEPFYSVLANHGITDPEKQLPRGAALGITQYLGTQESEVLRYEIMPNERAFGNFANGRFGWRLKPVHTFAKPLPVRGQQGLFKVEIPAESGDSDRVEPPPEVAMNTLTAHESTDARQSVGRFDYSDLLTVGMAQWDEYTHHPPTEWKHRLLRFWIRDDTDYLRTLALERQVLTDELATVDRLLAKARREYDKHGVEAAEHNRTRLTSLLRTNAADSERLTRLIAAWRRRHEQGVVECGFDDMLREG